MPESSDMTAVKVSIILPTFNRAGFLPDALRAIRSQSFTVWELIVVDDGSTDNTAEIISRWQGNVPQSVRYIYQENQGAYGARNTGLDHARGQYLAFYDSDDIWLSHHLADCVEGLEANPEVDWVYGACRIVSEETGKVQANSTFHVNGQPRPFLRLKARRSGKLRIIEDSEVVSCMVTYGGYNGLQNSVIRRSIFEGTRFESASRNEAEDQLFALRSLHRGFRMAYIDAVHVIYKLHSSNSSATGTGTNLERQARVLKLVSEGYERMLGEESWQPAERRAIRRRLLQEYFWKLGYATLWNIGRTEEAFQMFRKGLHHWPWDWRCWKTYVVSLAKSRIRTSNAKVSCSVQSSSDS